MVRSVIVALESSGSTCGIVEELRQRGVRCLVADSLKNFRRFLAVQPIAAVIVDAMYHGHSGIDLVREQPALRADTPVVLHSDRTSNRLEAALIGLKRGALDVLLAPYDNDTFATIAAIARQQVGPMRRRNVSNIPQTSENKFAEEPIGSSRLIPSSGKDPRGLQQSSNEFSAKRWTPLQRQERRLIVEALDQSGGHVVNASRLLRMGQATVYRKIRQYKILRSRVEQPQTA